MVRSIRRFPFKGLVLFGLGFLVATTVVGAGLGAVGSLIGLALFLPFLLLKFMFMFFVFALLIRVVTGRGGHHHRWGHRPDRRGWSGRGSRSGYPERDDEAQWRYRGRPMQPPAPEHSQEDAEWEEHLRQARREVEDLDAPYNQTNRDL